MRDAHCDHYAQVAVSSRFHDQVAAGVFLLGSFRYPHTGIAFVADLLSVTKKALVREKDLRQIDRAALDPAKDCLEKIDPMLNIFRAQLGSFLLPQRFRLQIAGKDSAGGAPTKSESLLDFRHRAFRGLWVPVDNVLTQRLEYRLKCIPDAPY